MAATGIEIRYELESNLRAGLARAQELGNDLTPAMSAIATHLEAVVRRRFEDEKGPGGVPWKPSERVRQNPGEKTLQLDGHLLGSIASRHDAASAEVGPVRSGPAAIYAAIHQFGGTIRPRQDVAKPKKALSFGGRVLASVTLPARPYVGFDDADRAAITEILTDHLRHAFGGPAVARSAP